MKTLARSCLISPSGWVQFRVMGVGDRETTTVTVGVDGAETRKSF